MATKTAIHKPLEWHKERQKTIGSSDVGAILGLSKYRSPLDVYHEKTADEPIITEMNAAMEFGLRLEDVIADKYMDDTGLKVQRRNKPYKHPEHPFAVNVDRIIVGASRGPGVLEIKTASGWAYRNWEEGLPLDYYAQLQFQLYVTGYKWGDIALLVDGREFKTMPFEVDEEFTAIMVHQLLDFWNNHVIPRIPPEPKTKKDIETVYPLHSDGKTVIANPPAIEEVERLRKIRQQIDELNELKEQSENKIKLLMQDAEKLVHPETDEVLITWKTVTSNRFNTSAFKKQYADLYESFSKQTTSRRFVVK